MGMSIATLHIYLLCDDFADSFRRANRNLDWSIGHEQIDYARDDGRLKPYLMRRTARHARRSDHGTDLSE
jgi:hypothetical protein